MRTLCFISARNLGDAVVHADLLKRLQRAGRADRWIVWTFAQARFLFEGLPDTEIVCSDFPMGATGRAFVRGGWRSFLSAVRSIRAKRPDETLDVVGDLRECLALRLIGARRLYSPKWAAGHPFRRHIRSLPFCLGRRMNVPATTLNLYEAQTLMLRTLVPSMPTDSGLPHRMPVHGGEPLRIGLHLSASAPFKLWPNERWTALIALLCNRFPGSHITLFGAPDERPALARVASGIDEPHEVFAAPLREFKTRLADIDLMFGLDSFSVHLAHSQGVPSVVLVGANDPQLFTPPSARAVTHPGRCSFQPCGGRPRCVGTDFQYSCMTSIEPVEVLNAATEALQRQHAATRPLQPLPS